MASITWPAGLPQIALDQSYTETLADNVIRQSMDAGPPVVRRRSSSNVSKITVSYSMSSDEWDTLVTFFQSTTAYGAERFEWPGALADETDWEVRFASPPARSPRGAGRWTVTIELEKLP